MEEELQAELHRTQQLCEVLEKDLFKSQAATRKLEAQVKQLQEINTINAKNTNNTSSKFSLPSEFKERWDMVTSEQIMDGFADFYDKFYLLVPLVQELFLTVRERIEDVQNEALTNIVKALKLSDSKNQKDLRELLYKKLKPVFQEHNQSIFRFRNDCDDEEEEYIRTFVQDIYKPRILPLVSSIEEGDHVDDLEENLGSDDFVELVKSVFHLCLHMVLNDPPIDLTLKKWSDLEIKEKTTILDRFDFFEYYKANYYCIDGFSKEKNGCVIVLPPPYRAGYVYQSIKPAVLVFEKVDEDNLHDPTLTTQIDPEKVKEHIAAKQKEIDEAEEAKKAKRAQSCLPDRKKNDWDFEANSAPKKLEVTGKQNSAGPSQQLNELQEAPKLGNLAKAAQSTTNEPVSPKRPVNLPPRPETAKLSQLSMTRDAVQFEIEPVSPCEPDVKPLTVTQQVVSELIEPVVKKSSATELLESLNGHAEATLEQKLLSQGAEGIKGEDPVLSLNEEPKSATYFREDESLKLTSHLQDLNKSPIGMYQEDPEDSQQSGAQHPQGLLEQSLDNSRVVPQERNPGSLPPRSDAYQGRAKNYKRHQLDTSSSPSNTSQKEQELNEAKGTINYTKAQLQSQIKKLAVTMRKKQYGLKAAAVQKEAKESDRESYQKGPGSRASLRLQEKEDQPSNYCMPKPIPSPSSLASPKSHAFEATRQADISRTQNLMQIYKQRFQNQIVNRSQTNMSKDQISKRDDRQSSDRYREIASSKQESRRTNYEDTKSQKYGAGQSIKAELEQKIQAYQNILMKTKSRVGTLQHQQKESHRTKKNEGSQFSEDDDFARANEHQRSFANLSSINKQESFDTTTMSHLNPNRQSFQNIQNSLHSHKAVDKPGYSSFIGEEREPWERENHQVFGSKQDSYRETMAQKKAMNLPQNIENIKRAYNSKMQILHQKLEEEKNRQRERSQKARADRSRSRSMTMNSFQKYSQQETKPNEDEGAYRNEGYNPRRYTATSGNSHGEEEHTQRSISPYQKWKMLPRQIQKPQPSFASKKPNGLPQAPTTSAVAKPSHRYGEYGGGGASGNSNNLRIFQKLHSQTIDVNRNDAVYGGSTTAAANSGRVNEQGGMRNSSGLTLTKPRMGGGGAGSALGSGYYRRAYNQY